jgi:hypothetical protein
LPPRRQFLTYINRVKPGGGPAGRDRRFVSPSQLGCGAIKLLLTQAALNYAST